MPTPAVTFEGVFPILVTPFDEQESLDLTSLERVVAFMRGIGMNGVTVLGVLGEANRLTDAEREAVVKTAVAAAGDMPVVVGTSHPGTAACRQLSQQAEQLGAAGVMVSPSREPTPSEQKVYEFFAGVAEGLSIPIVLQDHPASSQTWMSVELLLRMVNDIPQIACIKEEHPPTPQKITALLNGMTGRRVTLLQGLGALYGLFDLERGAHGFMTGFAFPEVLAAMVQAARGEDMARAWAIYQRYLPLIVYEQQPALGIRKEIYRLRGLIRSSRVRHPGAGIDPTTAQALQRLLDTALPGVDVTKPLPVE